MKYDTKTFTEKAKEIHNNKYDYSLVKYIKSNIKIKIICHKHGIFEQTPVSHIRKDKPRGCPSCSGKNKTINQFINEAKIIHKNKYNYSKVIYINATTPIIIICPIHGDFKQKPSSHLTGYGCKICGGNNKSTTEEFIIKANKIHNKKYSYSKVNYISSHDNIIITCSIHGDFKQKPNNHLSGQECYQCSKIIQSNKKILKAKNGFINKASNIHNNKYNYSLVDYINNRSKIKIICPKHGIFKQKVNSHLNGSGCPKCNTSKGELCIEKFLLINNIKYQYQKTFNNCINKNNRKLKFDFYLPIQNILIEFDGKQHFEPIKYFGGQNSFNLVKEYDKIKNDYAKNNNIKLIRISYKEFKYVNKILSKILINKKDYTW